MTPDQARAIARKEIAAAEKARRGRWARTFIELSQVNRQEHLIKMVDEVFSDFTLNHENPRREGPHRVTE